VPLRSNPHAKPFPEPDPSSPPSPYIIRRQLDATTERELRAACKLILQNFKPSDADFADVDPKLDFSGPHKRREQPTEPLRPSHSTRDVRVHRPTGAPAETNSPYEPKKHSHKTYPHLPMVANTARRREDHRNAVPSATQRTDVDSDDGKSLATPLTASTDAHVNAGSTAPTSVGSQRASRQYENAAAVVDAQAAEWMRQELEKRRQKAAPAHPSETHQSSHRPPSRTGSIRAGIKEYMFPASRSLTRVQSRDSISATNSHPSASIKRSGSMTGWRSWGFHRSRSNSRPGTSSGRIDRPEKDQQPSLNLNRKLPPLPSLDTWKDIEAKEKEKEKVKEKSQVQGTHIAQMMRTQDQQQIEYAAARRHHHRRSGSDTMVLRYANAQSAPSPSKSRKPALAPLDTSMDFDHMMSAMSSSRNLHDHPKLYPNGYAPQRSTSTASKSPSTQLSSDARHAPNFSRKISSLDFSCSQMGEQDPAYVRAIQIPGSGQHKEKEDKKSSLRKVLSGWMVRKEKKDDWMQQLERRGIKGGVMTQDEEAALPPVVRY
jgi:hypothetical protein